MYSLSHAVEVPQTDIDAGNIAITRDAAGEMFDGSDVTGRLLTIRSSKTPPNNPAVAVDYRRYGFYISDPDIAPTSTFSLLSELFALQSRGGASVAPILTLPVGGCRHRAANAPESRAACKLANLTAAGKRATVDTLRTLSATEEALRLR
tara:strand:+ start:159 stop:608 length:450 start_codon:yes stop_codon:yes gene_type:complete